MKPNESPMNAEFARRLDEVQKAMIERMGIPSSLLNEATGPSYSSVSVSNQGQMAAKATSMTSDEVREAINRARSEVSMNAYLIMHPAMLGFIRCKEPLSLESDRPRFIGRTDWLPIVIDRRSLLIHSDPGGNVEPTPYVPREVPAVTEPATWWQLMVIVITGAAILLLTLFAVGEL